MGFRKNTEIAKSGQGYKNRQFVNALARGMDILKAFRTEDRWLSNAELSRRTNLPKPTVSRLTFTLMSLGYLDLDEETGFYLLHPHILSLGYPVLQRLSIRQIARPYIQELAEYCQGTVSIGLRDGLNMIIIIRVRHSSMADVPVDIGAWREMATSAMGRAYIAAAGAEERTKLFEEMEAAYGKRWPELKAAIDSDLSAYVEKGYCTSAGDWMTEYNAVGAPLALRDGTILAVNCGGLRSKISKDDLPDLGVRLVETTRKLERIHRDTGA